MFSHCRWGCGYSVACGFLQMTLTACNVRCIFFSPSVSMHLCVCAEMQHRYSVTPVFLHLHFVVRWFAVIILNYSFNEMLNYPAISQIRIKTCGVIKIELKSTDLLTRSLFPSISSTFLFFFCKNMDFITVLESNSTNYYKTVEPLMICSKKRDIELFSYPRTTTSKANRCDALQNFRYVIVVHNCHLTFQWQ